MKMKISECTEKQIYPLFNYVFVRIENENPHLEKVTKSGLHLPTGLSYEPGEGSGKIETAEQFIKFGVVEEVGTEVKCLKIGDGVFLDKRSVRPVPFGVSGVVQVNEQNVLAYVR